MSRLTINFNLIYYRKTFWLICVTVNNQNVLLWFENRHGDISSALLFIDTINSAPFRSSPHIHHTQPQIIHILHFWLTNSIVVELCPRFCSQLRHFIPILRALLRTMREPSVSVSGMLNSGFVAGLLGWVSDPPLQRLSPVRAHVLRSATAISSVLLHVSCSIISNVLSHSFVHFYVLPINSAIYLPQLYPLKYAA